MIVPGTVLMAKVFMNFGGVSFGLNRFIVRYDGPVTISEAEASTALGNWADSMYTNFEDYMVLGAEADYVECRHWDGLEWVWFGDQPVDVPGSHVGEMLPPGVAVLVKAGLQVGGEKNRKFLGGFPEIYQVAGQWTGGLLIACVAFATAWVTPFQFNLNSYVPGGWVKLTKTFVPYSLTTWVATDVAYLRTRKQGVGY